MEHCSESNLEDPQKAINGPECLFFIDGVCLLSEDDLARTGLTLPCFVDLLGKYQTRMTEIDQTLSDALKTAVPFHEKQAAVVASISAECKLIKWFICEINISSKNRVEVANQLYEPIFHKYNSCSVPVSSLTMIF